MISFDESTSSFSFISVSSDADSYIFSDPIYEGFATLESGSFGNVFSAVLGDKTLLCGVNDDVCVVVSQPSTDPENLASELTVTQLPMDEIGYVSIFNLQATVGDLIGDSAPEILMLTTTSFPNGYIQFSRW